MSDSIIHEGFRNKFNKDYMLGILDMLLNTPSPTGFCQAIMGKVEAEAVKLGYKLSYTNKGNAYIVIPGRQAEPMLGLSAHVDTLGAMVRSIKDNGRLRFTSIGGYMMGSVENEYCTVHTRDGRTYEGTIMSNKPSVHVFPDAREWKREEAVMEVRLDEPVKSKQDAVNLGIRAGDYISFDPRAKMLSNGLIKSRHLDDKQA